MISYLGIRNFKSLKSLHLKPSKLNLCFGMNGMGKSTLLQAMMLLRQSEQKGMLENKGLLLSGGDLVNIGTGKDAFYQFAGSDDLMEFEIRSAEQDHMKWAFSLDAASDLLPVAHTDEGGGKNGFSLSTFSLFNENFAYLATDRVGPQKVYSKSDFEVIRSRSVGTKGQYAVHYLARFGMEERIQFENLRYPNAKSDTLLHQTAGWLSEICPGTRLVIEDLRGTDLLKLAFQFETADGYTNEFSPLNVGFGLVYALPVIVVLLRSKPGDLVLMENPESHLNPRGQSTIGRLLACVAANDVQIFCESHSDHIINGARVAVKEKLIPQEDLAIYYFSRDIHSKVHKTEVTQIGVDPFGELSHYPEGLLDEWNNLLVKLI